MCWNALSGSLWLAASLDGSPSVVGGRDRSSFCTAFNFGPNLQSNQTVAELVQAILAVTGGNWIDESDPDAPHEASKLNLAVDRAFHVLGWKPIWSFEQTVHETASFYQRAGQGESVAKLVNDQIRKFEQAAAADRLPWAVAAKTGQATQKAAG